MAAMYAASHSSMVVPHVYDPSVVAGPSVSGSEVLTTGVSVVVVSGASVVGSGPSVVSTTGHSGNS